MFMQLWNPWYHAVLCWGNPAWCNTKRAMLSRSNLAMWVFAKWQHELTIIVGLIQNAGINMKPARVKQCLSNQPWLGLVSLSHLQKWWRGMVYCFTHGQAVAPRSASSSDQAVGQLEAKMERKYMTIWWSNTKLAQLCIPYLNNNDDLKIWCFVLVVPTSWRKKKWLIGSWPYFALTLFTPCATTWL